MAQKRKNDGELPENWSCKKKQKTKGKANFIFSAMFSSPLSFITKNNFLVILGKKSLVEPPSIHQLHVDDSIPKSFLLRGPKDSMFSLYCCPLSPVQQVKDVQKLKLDCPSTLKPRHCLIDCCYNGLAIIEIRDKDRVKLLLWNPSIRESIVVPPLGCPGDGRSRFGLGYDSSSGEYKILHMHQNLDGPNYPNEIIALKGGSWRSIDEHPRANRRWIYAMDYLPFIHAAFHWIQVSRNYFVVFSFNISNKVYGEIPLSEKILSLKPGPDTVGVSVLEGMLCVHSNLFFMVKGTFKVWVLKEYVKDTPYYNASPRYRFVDGEVLFWCVNLKARGHAFRMVNKTSWSRWVTRGHAIRMVDRPFRSWPRCDTSQGGQVFTESLLSPKSLTY
ncbi:hypothetical protein R3W88_028862 [Solanum pinnatisectum]|uniref:F-box associated beta-propeller type 3 domain-containing protein n=1 Tax=Solanum pinnatisectum TaxID=50273 RepID=A0AAV9K6Z4_9SOLN|nr:hypothetical protein R3W88_028862 [Solanum pinnatisectum]